MTWPRDESRPRITPDSRRAGLLTLVLGGLVIAGLLVVLIPAEQNYGSSSLYCGTPLSAAFKSSTDYVRDYLAEHETAQRNGQDTSGLPSSPSAGLRDAGAACVSNGRTRVSIGAGLLLLALLGGVGALVDGRRRRNNT